VKPTIDAMKGEFRKRLEEDFDASDNYKPNKADWLDGRWSGLKATKDDDDPRRGKTGVNVDRLKTLGKQITAVPDGFNIHRTLKRVMDARAKAIEPVKTSTGPQRSRWPSPRCWMRVAGAPVGPGRGARYVLAAPFAVWVDQETEKRYMRR
jgi:2-oxoglutarate dehydrogenase E1 component